MATIPAPGSYVTTTKELGGKIRPRAAHLDISSSQNSNNDPMIRTINESSVVTINKNGDFDMVKKIHEVRCPLSRMSESLGASDMELLNKSIQQQQKIDPKKLNSAIEKAQQAKYNQSNIQPSLPSSQSNSPNIQPAKYGNLRSIAHNIQVNNRPREVPKSSGIVERSVVDSQANKVKTGIGIMQNGVQHARFNPAGVAQVRDTAAIRLMMSNPYKLNVKTASSIPKRTRSIGYKTLNNIESKNEAIEAHLYATDSTISALQQVSDSSVTLRAHPPSKLKECTYAQDDVKLRPRVTISDDSSMVPSNPTARPHSIDHGMLLNMLGDNKVKKKKWGLSPESSLFKSSLKKKLTRKVETDGIFSPARFYDGKKHKRFALDTHPIESGFAGTVEIELLKYNDNRKIRVGMINADNLDNSPIIESRKSKSVIKALAKKLANKTVISFEFRKDVIKANVNGEIAQTKSREIGADYIPYIQIGSKMNAKITITREGEEPKTLTLR